MPVGRPPRLETPQVVRQIPRAEPADPVEEVDDPPLDPPEPFFWTTPVEPRPGRLRPIPALIGDTLRFALGNWPSMLFVALPAVAILVLAGLVRWWAYEQFVAPSNSSSSGLIAHSLISIGASSVVALGTYFQSVAVAFVVVRHAQHEPTRLFGTSRRTLRRLPRVVTVNAIFGLLVAVTLGAPLFFLGWYLGSREMFHLMPWGYLMAGVIAYSAPQINIYLTAIKLEDQRPKFRRARQLVRGQRAAVLGRVLLCQFLYVVPLVIWQLVEPEVWSVGLLMLTVPSVVVPAALMTTAFTLLFVDLAGVAAADPVPDDEPTLIEDSGVGDDIPVQRST